MRDHGYPPKLEKNIWETYVNYYRSNPDHLKLTQHAPDILPDIDSTSVALAMKPPTSPADDVDVEWMESIDRDAYNEEKQNFLLSQLDSDMMKDIKKRPTGADAEKRRQQLAAGKKRKGMSKPQDTPLFTDESGTVSIPLPVIDVASTTAANVGSSSTDALRDEGIEDDLQETADSVFKKARVDLGTNISVGGIFSSLGVNDMTEFDDQVNNMFAEGVDTNYFNHDI